MATEREQPKVLRQKSKIDEELDYFTELALHESERWMQAVTRKKFKYPDDPRKSLEDGILMCELLNGLKPGTIRKVNRLPTPLAGMDNVNVFLEACSKTFGLKDAQLFHPCDLEDLSNRAFADSQDQLKYETDRRLRNVVVTVYWLGRTVQPWYKGPHLDCSAFSDLLGYHHPKVHLTNVESSSENILSDELHCRQESCDSLDCSSGYSSYRGDSKTSSSSYSQHHSRQESSDSIDRGSVYIRNDNAKSSLSSDVFEDDPVTSQLRDEPYESFVSEDLPLTRRLNTEKRQSDNITPDTGETDNMPIPQEYRCRASHGNRFAEQRYSATFDSPYTPPPEGATSPNLLSNRWKNHAVYQSTPQLNRAGRDDCNRFRFGGNKLEKQGKASSSSDNIDGVKPGERRNSYLPPVQVRKASTAHADPLQFVYVGGSQLSQKAKEVIEAMEEQKKVTKALEHEELDWHSNLSSWKSKMRTKNKAAHERTEEIDKTLEDPEPSHRKSKTFGEMMAERERRKSTGRNFYPYTEEDVGALGGVNRLNSAQTTQDSATVTSVYRKSTNSNSQSSDNAHIRRTETFESEHSVKTNNNQPSSRVTELSTTQSYNRYTVSQNARTRTKSQPDNAGETTRDRGREMMERRKEESENQLQRHRNDTTENRPHARDYRGLVNEPRVPRWQHQESDDVFSEPTKPSRMSMQERRSMFERGMSTEEMPRLTKPRVENTSRPRRFENIDSSTSAPLVKPQDVCLYRHKPVLPPDLAPSQGLGSGMGINKWETTENLTGVAPREQDVMSAEEPILSDVMSPESQVTQDVTSTENGQENAENDSEEFEEKTIKISQKPNGEKGFGFTIGGGKEHCCPIVIEKVSLGSAADAYGLVEGDEIVAINGVAMDDSYQGSVLYVINQAVRTGLMDLRIRRYPFADSDESEDEREQEQQKQEELERQRQEEEQQRLKQEQEEQRRRELEEQQRQEEQRAEQLRLEQEREQQRHLKRQQLEKQREELRQQKLQQLEQQRLKQQKQEPLPRRRRQQEQQPQEQQLVEKQQERRRQEEQQQKEQQQRIEQQQEAEHQLMEQQWLEKQQQEQQRQEQQQKEQRWLEQQQQEQQQQQLQELEQNRVEQQWQEQQQQQEQQQWEQQQWEQQQPPEGEQQNEQLPGEQLIQEEQQLVEDDRQQDDVTVSQTEMDYHQMELPEVPSEPPPPLPSMPPPAPNWNTFPTVTGEFANTDDDFFDQNDLLPDLDMAKKSMEENTGGEEREAPVTPVTPETGCVRTDILRRKSQFLGLEKCEEYHTLQTDKQQKERIEWERIEATDSILKDLRSIADTRPPENLWQPPEGATHDTSYSPYNTSQSTNIFDPSSAYDLEQREMDIIANLERDEEASRQLVNNCCHDNGDIYQDQCSSRSTDSVHSSTVASIEARATLDMQSTLSMAPLTQRSPTERRMFDLEEERRRMEEWDTDQEEKRKPEMEWNDDYENKQLYEAEQQRIRKKHEEELRKSQQLEEERQRELAEKEEKQQQRFDELQRQAEVENQRQQEEQEKIRQAEEKRRIRQQQQEDEKRKLRQVERRSNSRENEQNTFPWQTPQTMREAIDTDRMRVEQEKILAERETARKREDTDRAQKQAEEQQRLEEEERVRKAKEEQRRMEEERVRKAEKDQRLQEEREAKALREREEQLRLMEERIRREAEKLRLEKERFEIEKTNHQKPWSMPQSNPAGYDAPPEYDAPPIPTHTMPSYEEPKVDEVRLSYVPRNNAYQGQYEQTYEPNNPDNISPTSQPQFHIEFKTEPNRIFTLHQQQDNDYNYRGNNGLSPRTTFEKLPRRELPIQPKPSLREEMGLRPESRRTYGSQSNVAGRSPTGSEASLSDTGREAALRSSRLPSGNSSYYPTRDTMGDNARRHSEYQRRPEPVDDFSPKSAPPWADSLKPVTTAVNQDDQVSPTHLTKAELHQIAAVPRPRFSDNWIKPAEEPKRRPAPRRSEIMRQNINHAGEHWLFEEAERRRLASQQGTQHLQKRQDPLQYQQWWSQKAVVPSDGSNGYSVEYSGDSGYGLPQRYDFDEQSRSLSSPAYRTSYDGSDRYDRYGNQPSLIHPTSTDQVLTDRVTLVRYTDTSPHNHPNTAPKPNSPSYHYAPSPTQQYHYPHSDNLSLSQNPYPSYPDHQQPSQVSYPSAEPVHSRTSSQNSEPPPVPPKPPRLLAGGENSHPAEQVIAVNGYQACANCGDALGQGAAMVIEPLGLYYHIECFRCCVCYAPLGTGERGTDVRVRASRLHCQNCYSSDEDGLKYSRV